MPTDVPKAARGGRVWLGLLVLYIVWGSTYLGIAVAVETIPPFLMAGIRFALAGLVLLTWSIVRAGGAFRAPTLVEWRDSAIVGAMLLGGGMGMVAWGEQTIPSGIAALIIALMPVWVAVLGRLFLGERLPGAAVIGIVVGFAGVGILVAPTIAGGAGALDPLGLAALLISPISWSAGSLFASHRATLPKQPLVATGLQMVTGSLVLFGMALLTGEPERFDPGAVSRDSLVALAYLTVIGSLLAFTVYGWLLRVAPLPFIATYAYVNPVVAVLLGWAFAGEAMSPRALAGAAIIVAGVALIVSGRASPGTRHVARAPERARGPA